MLRYAKQYLAARKLQKLIDRWKASPEGVAHMKRREASKLGWQRRRANA